MDERAKAESQKQEDEDERLANFNEMLEAQLENEELAGRVRPFTEVGRHSPASWNHSSKLSSGCENNKL